MHYQINPIYVTFFLDNEKSNTSSKANVLCAWTPLTEENLILIADTAIRHIQGRKITSQRNYISHFIRPIIEFALSTKSALPQSSNEWQIYILNLFQFYLSDSSWTSANAKTRMSNWTSLVRPSLEFWAFQDILPSDVFIPAISRKKIIGEATQKPTLGKSTPKSTPTTDEPGKLLVDVNFGLSDAKYLELIEQDCRSKIDLIRNVCIDHWRALMHDGAVGQNFANMVPLSMIEKATADGRFADLLRGGTAVPLASSAHPDGIKWGLSLSKKMLSSGNKLDCISVAAHQNGKFFAKKIFEKGRYPVLNANTAMPAEAFKQLTGYAQFARFAGVLSVQDAAVACCLLTIEHPEFTSDALQSARLLNSRGKSHLILTDNNESSILSLDKPRAGRRIKVVLTPLAQKIVTDIIAWTSEARKVLKRAGDKAWRYLFLGHGQGGRLVLLSPTPRILNAADTGNSLISLYPALAKNGLVNGVFDYRRIRATMGVIRWFETGSISAMSKRLGNSYRVVLKHYLPPALLHAWNTRIIRRFQNTLIILAAHKEDYLLDVTDFSSVNDLQHFIAQLILEYPGDSSPLAKEVQSRFLCEGENGEGENALLGAGVLNIRLSSKSLSYLYAFSDYAVANLSEEKLGHTDAQTRLAPIQFIDLARMIRHACEINEIAAEMSEILDLPHLRRVHHEATVLQKDINTRLESISLQPEWEENLV